MVVLVLFYTGPNESGTANPNFLWKLTTIQLALATVLLLLAPVISKRLLAVVADGEPLSPEGYFRAIRKATIVRLALMEGGALYGLVVCTLAVMNGTMHEYPVFWINLAGAVAMLLSISWNFPTRERVIKVYEKMILNP